MNVFEFLIEHGRLLTAFNIKPILLERELDYKDGMGDMLEAYEALNLVEKMAYKAGSGEVDFDIAYFLKIYPEYSEVAWSVFNEARIDRLHSPSEVVDLFKPQEPKAGGFAFPCNICKHNDNGDNEYPRVSCDHNSNCDTAN